MAIILYQKLGAFKITICKSQGHICNEMWISIGWFLVKDRRVICSKNKQNTVLFCSSILLSQWLFLHLSEFNLTGAANVWSINKKWEEISFCKRYHINWTGNHLFFFFPFSIVCLQGKVLKNLHTCINLPETVETAKEDTRST